MYIYQVIKSSILIFVLLLFVRNEYIRAKDSISAKDNPRINRAFGDEEQPLYIDPPTKSTRDSLKHLYCEKYKDAFVLYYDTAYFIKDCKKYKLRNETLVKLSHNKNFKITEVTGEIIQSFADAGFYLDKFEEKSLSLIALLSKVTL